MNSRLALIAAACATFAALPVEARMDLGDDSSVDGGGSTRLPPYLQCVPYARQVTGIQIYGDAYTWWGQAEGRYARGYQPKVGAVMALRPHGNSTLGHVAAVSRIVNDRTILIRHANWSPIEGRRGQIEDNVKVIDVSPENDWSQVRVWYAPIQDLGGSVWPVQGFIYPARPGKVDAPRWSLPGRAPVKLLPQSSKSRPSRDPIGDIIKRRMKW
ncbi:MAG: CHAP domain-containing protein [Novosphingobium sp.]